MASEDDRKDKAKDKQKPDMTSWDSPRVMNITIESIEKEDKSAREKRRELDRK